MKVYTYLALMLCILTTSATLGMKIIEAAKKGDTEKIKRLIKRKTKNINEKDTYGWTPLMHAVHGNHKNAAERLLINLADVNHKDYAHQWTPLNIAISQNNVDMTKMLISYGADVNDADDEGWTPLMLAAHNNRAKIVALLLEKGAYGNARNKHGKTALLLAINNGNKETIEVLLQHGVGKVNQALVMVMNKAHKKGLSTEDQKKYTDIIELLERFAGKTPLPQYSTKPVDQEEFPKQLRVEPGMTISKKEVYVPEKEDFESVEDFKKYVSRKKIEKTQQKK